MKLSHVSLLSILACLVGLVLLVIYSGFSFREIRNQQQEFEDILVLQQQINVFSTASDSMLLFRPGPELWQAYLSDASIVVGKLQDMGDRYPDALKAANNVRQILAMVDTVVGAKVRESDSSNVGPLPVPERSRLIMNQVAMSGIALDAALTKALNQRQTSVADKTRQIMFQLTLAGILFGAMCVVAFTLIHRRITKPVLHLAKAIGGLRSGDRDVRVPLEGDDELATLAEAFNHLVDDLQAQESSLLRLKDQYERAEIVADLGSWEVDYDSGVLHWSPRVFEIFGLSPSQFDATDETFFERVHPADRDWFLRKRAEWLEGDNTDFEGEHRILRPDGTVRWVRESSRIFYRADGTHEYSTGTIQDITEEKARESEMMRLSSRLAQVVESISEGMMVIDRNFNYEFGNTTSWVLLGQSRELVQANPIEALSQGLDDTTVAGLLDQAMSHSKVITEEFLQPSTEKWLELRVYPGAENLTLFIRDISERHRAIEALHYTLALRKALFNALPAHIALLDNQGTIQDVNEQWRHFGQKNAYTTEDYGLGANYLEICDAASGDCAEEATEVADGIRRVLGGESDVFTLEYPCHGPDTRRWFRVMASIVDLEETGAPSGAVVMHIDVTERKLAEIKLETLAFYDPLTGLLNRVGFERELEKYLEKRWHAGGMVMLLDIVGQRDINAAFGYTSGDHVLVEIAHRLVKSVGEDAVVSRLGGDEFALFVPSQGAISLEWRRQAINQVFENNVSYSGHDIAVRARCGYTVLGSMRRSVDDLVAEAELALFQPGEEMQLPAISWSRYSSKFEAQLRIREELVHELRQATEAGAFELHFQPKVRLDSGELIAAEALIRWPHPTLGLQSPGVFIPLAEQSQLIGPMGTWVINEACRHLRSWQEQELEIVRISVNVSFHQFILGDLVAIVEQALRENNVAPEALSLEITESVFEEESIDLQRQLVMLHEMGVRLSLDDFGTGYSSLLYLQRYPFDEIKIDQAFVHRMMYDPYSRHVVDMVVDLASVLGADVVAEGIESEEVGVALKAAGCGIGQGFYYSMPLEAEDFRWLLQQRTPLPLHSKP